MSRCSSLVEEDVRTRSNSWRMMRPMASSRALALSWISVIARESMKGSEEPFQEELLSIQSVYANER